MQRREHAYHAQIQWRVAASARRVRDVDWLRAQGKERRFALASFLVEIADVEGQLVFSARHVIDAKGTVLRAPQDITALGKPILAAGRGGGILTQLGRDAPLLRHVMIMGRLPFPGASSGLEVKMKLIAD